MHANLRRINKRKNARHAEHDIGGRAEKYDMHATVAT
jgi:hypothetical protein